MKKRTFLAAMLICALLLPLCGIPAAAAVSWENVMNMEFGADTPAGVFTQSGTTALSQLDMTAAGAAMTLPSGKLSSLMLDFKKSAALDAQAAILDNGTYYLEYTYTMTGMSTGMLDIRPMGLGGSGTFTSNIRFEAGKIYVNSNAADKAELKQNVESKVGWLIKVDGVNKGNYTLYCDGTAVGGEKEWQYGAASLTQSDFLFNNNCDAAFTLKSVNAWAKHEASTPEEDRAAVANDKAKLTLPGNGTAYMDFALPAAGEQGSAITWTASGSGITVDGGKAKVQTEAAGGAAVLTATIKKNDAAQTKEFSFAVPANLNRGAAATANESHNSGIFGPEKTVDGDRGGTSRWSAQSKKACWLQYDLGEPTSFDKVVIYDFNGRIQECKIEGSNDGSNWNLLAEKTYSDASVRDIDFPRAAYRHLRLTISKYADTPSLYEVEVYNLPTAEEKAAFQEDVDSVTEASILNGQSKDAVKGKLTLPDALENGTDVAWSSQPQDIIAADGTVTQPSDENKTVTLTARFSKAAAALTAEKTFTVTVLKAEKIYIWKQAARMEFGMDMADDLFQASGATPRNAITKTADGVQIKRGDATLCTDELLLKKTALAGADSVTVGPGKYYIEAAYQVDGNDKTIDIGMRGPNTEGILSSSTNVRFDGTQMQYRDAGDKLVNIAGHKEGTEETFGYELDMKEGAKGDFKLYLNRGAVTGFMTWKWGAVQFDRLNISTNLDTAGTLLLKSVTIWEYAEATAQEAFEKDMEGLTEASILNGQAADNITGDLNLPQRLPYGTQVQWSTQPAGIIAAGGVVTRPAEEDKAVTITAQAQSPAGVTTQKTFDVVVKKALIPSMSDADAVAYDKKRLNISENDWVDSDFTLPERGEKGSSITWESDNAAIRITPGLAAVTVTPGQSPSVTLTATIQKGTQTETKTFVLTVVSNIAFGKPGTASASHNSGKFNPDQAVDGDREVTRWASSGSTTQWMRFDLGSETTFNRVNVYDYNGRCQNVSIQGSHNDSDWETIQTQTFSSSQAGSILLAFDLPESTYRYVKLMINKASAEPSIYEFEVYYTPEAATLKDSAALNAQTVTDEPLGALTKNTKILPVTGENGSVITWESSDPDVLELSPSGGGVMGLLHHPVAEDETVRLTAYVTKNGCNDRSKTFLLTTKGSRSGLFYSIDESFDTDGLPESLWDGGAVVKDGKMDLKLTGTYSTFYPMTKSVALRDEFQFELDLAPAEESGAVAIALLSTEKEALATARLDQENGSWTLTAGGAAARGVTANENGALHLKFEVADGGTVLRIYCNGDLLGAQLLDGGVHGIGFKASDGGAAVSVDNVKACTMKSKVLDAVAAGLSAAGFTSQNPDAITKDLSFAPQILEGVSCGWASSNPAVVSEKGIVNREKGSGDTPVTITQTVYLTEDPAAKKEVTHEIHVLQVDKTNELVGASMTVTGTAAAGSESGYAIDGTKRTAFEVNGNGNKAVELKIDAGYELPVTEIELNESMVDGAYHIKGYQLAVSMDGKTWKTVQEGTEAGESVKAALDGTRIRHIKLTVTQKDGTIGIAELSARTPSQGRDDAAAADLAEILKSIPAAGSSLEAVFNIPVTGKYGSAITVEGAPAANISTTKVTLDGAPYYRISVARSAQDAMASVKIRAAYRDQKAEETVSYLVPGNGGSGGGSGGGGSHSGGTGNGGTGFIGGGTAGTGTLPQPQPVGPSDPYAQELEGRWCEKEVRSLLADGIVKGVSGDSLGLENQTTRAEFITMLVRVMGLDTSGAPQTFDDVDAGEWYAPFIAAAAENGLMRGDGGNARPGDPVSREEMAVLAVAAYVKLTGRTPQAGELNFTDKENIADWAAEAAAQAGTLGLIQGYEDGSFQPEGNALREQVIVIIYRLKQLTEA